MSEKAENAVPTVITEVFERPWQARDEPKIIFLIDEDIFYWKEITASGADKKIHEQAQMGNYSGMKTMSLKSGTVAFAKDVLVFTAANGKKQNIKFDDASEARDIFHEMAPQLGYRDKIQTRTISVTERFMRAKNALVGALVFGFIAAMVPFITSDSGSSFIGKMLGKLILKIGANWSIIIFGGIAVCCLLYSLRRFWQNPNVEFFEFTA